MKDKVDKYGNDYQAALKTYSHIEGKRIRGFLWLDSKYYYVVLPQSLKWDRLNETWCFTAMEDKLVVENCGLFPYTWVVQIDMEKELEYL